ncbi:hypothetical protein HX030_12330 [Myroides odoratimimus]|uniref:hypothetical protein n=1 Tax=Myroides odoratimimus TaxID=76832 RepID=UPI00257794F5|nr:hypothetical protein [Myroides odoratimimus]MDM1467815.1 hypothetical protein [Myroides odoratimimus]MDM1471061.1 hypothetical protein [Myroides odoratimimus]MDM1481093.1 hypothetical protein [Myroides odoratimimus]
MKKEVVNKFEIKLEFNKDTEEPSRLFRSFADLIDSIKELDTTLAKTINSNISSKIYLDDIEKGSLIGKLWNHLVINENNKIDDNNIAEETISEFIEESRSKSIEFIESGKSEVIDLEKLAKNIDELAEEKGIKETFNYAEPNILDLAKNLNDINEAVSKLSDDERFIIKDSKNKTEEISKGTEKINLEDVEKALTTEEIKSQSIVFYKIKRPDFLGDSQWDFKHGNKSLKVKILHEEWLEDFKQGKVIVVPGDSLKVKIKQSFKYNKHGYLISEKTEIIEVLEIKRNK